MATYVIFTDRGHWGLGESVDTARAAVRREGARLLDTCVVKKLADGATDVRVDSYGGIAWEGTREAPTVVFRGRLRSVK